MVTATHLADLDGLRDLAVGVAYRMVGSRTEAEDLAQEVLLRVEAAAGEQGLDNPEAFVTTVTTRLAIDHLRSARVRRERYVGPWLPEPVATDPLADPSAGAALADSLSFAVLVVLERLSPLERAAFLLHDVFGYAHHEVAEVLGRSEAACRQLVSRARRAVRGDRRRRAVAPEAHRALLERFLAAARHGDLDALESLLADDAVLLSDGGPRRKAARHPILGRDRVARFLRRVGPRVLADHVEPATINGAPGFRAYQAGALHLVGTVEVDDSQVVAVHWVLNPDKLRWAVPPDPPQPG